MNEISDIKEVLSDYEWKSRIEKDPKRIYGFILCTDEHTAFQSFIQKAWGTLHYLSGEACDIFTLEHWKFPHEKLISKSYIQIPGARSGAARIARGDDFGFIGQNILIDNGLMLPDRAQCFEVRDKLFANPNKIILPGLAIFPSPYLQEAVYYNCSDLDETQLSSSFQAIFNSVKEAYKAGGDSSDVFGRFQRIEKVRFIQERLTKAVLKLSLRDIFDVLTGSISIVVPKAK
jgi:hypothetical protein